MSHIQRLWFIWSNAQKVQRGRREAELAQRMAEKDRAKIGRVTSH